MLQPDPFIARSQALQFKGALALTHPKHGFLVSAALLHYAGQKGQAQSICTAFESSALICLTKAFTDPQAEQGCSSLRRQGSPRLPRNTRATCSSPPRNYSPILKQENLTARLCWQVPVMAGGMAGPWVGHRHPPQWLAPSTACRKQRVKEASSRVRARERVSSEPGSLINVPLPSATNPPPPPKRSFPLPGVTPSEVPVASTQGQPGQPTEVEQEK